MVLKKAKLNYFHIYWRLMGKYWANAVDMTKLSLFYCIGSVRLSLVVTKFLHGNMNQTLVSVRVCVCVCVCVCLCVCVSISLFLFAGPDPDFTTNIWMRTSWCSGENPPLLNTVGFFF